MLCILEIAMTVMGVVALSKGQVNFVGARVVRGAPAYLIGTLLALTFPLVLGAGFVIGILLAANGQQANLQNNLWLIFVDIGVIAGIAVPCFIIAAVTAKVPAPLFNPAPAYGNYNFQQPIPPQDPNNPYASPFTDNSPHP